jgi:tRNA(Met) C34 N-acetyltransferase TmcA
MVSDDALNFLYSYSNIFVTSPSPDNLHTLFEFIFKGFDALQYQVRHLTRTSFTRLPI